jgi:hypothetical protein
MGLSRVYRASVIYRIAVVCSEIRTKIASWALIISDGEGSKKIALDHAAVVVNHLSLAITIYD